MADLMLDEAFRLPELLSNYIPELRQAVQHSLTLGCTLALGNFLAWVLITRLARPSGPGQVARGWSRLAWWVLAVVTAVGAFFIVWAWVLAGLDTIDRQVAIRFAALVAVVALIVFWVLCLFGTELMLRPAVLGGSTLAQVRR